MFAKTNLATWLLACLLLITGASWAQNSKEALRKKRAKLLDEIAYTNQLLTETRERERNTIAEVEAIDRKIEVRTSLVATINAEVQLLEREISESEEELKRLSTQRKMLEERYAERIRKAYQARGQYQQLMFVLSANDFNQAYLRLQYLKQYQAYRRDLAEQIEQSRKDVDLKIASLQEQQVERREVMARQLIETQLLSSERTHRAATIEQLKGAEQQLRKEVSAKQKQAAQLQAEIERLIREEIERARKEAEARRKAEEAKSGKPTSENFSLTPEAQALSDNFAQNRGKLPWPVEKGYLSSPYGEHAHPVLPGIRVKNDGIDITTNRDALARAVFEGEVSGIVVIPGVGEAVILKHGEYLTVYSNLAEVYVKKGERVTLKQMLGKVSTNPTDGKTVLQFQLWKNTEKQNPAIWVAQP